MYGINYLLTSLCVLVVLIFSRIDDKYLVKEGYT